MTETKKSTASKNDALFLEILDHISDEVMLIGQDGRIAFVNRAAIQGLGYSRGEILNRPIVDFFHEKLSLKEWKTKYFFRLKEKKEPVPFLIERVVKGGDIQSIELTAVYMPYQSQGYVLSIARNTTERRRLEALVRESEKIKAFQNFIVGVTQEIQYPLKGLLDHSHTLVEKYKGRDFEYIGYKEFRDIMSTLETMRDRVKYCFDTTNRLLSIDRQKMKLKSSYCDVNDMLREAVKMLQHALDVSEIKFQLRLASPLPPAAVDPLDLGEVLSVILTNAIQAMPRGGAVRLTTIHRKKEKMVHIECRDDGVGIPAEILPHIFDPFFTTKHRGLGKSSGLGLSIAYSIIKTFKGDIKVQSRPGQGTVVRVALPVYSRAVRK